MCPLIISICIPVSAGTEDCLYIYVYVPGENIDRNANLPVVIHIHGGAFMLGSPQIMVQPEYLMDQDIIFVSFNYRLGILGEFFSMR